LEKGGYRRGIQGDFEISPNPSLRKRGEHPVLRTPLYERGMNTLRGATPENPVTSCIYFPSKGIWKT